MLQAMQVSLTLAITAENPTCEAQALAKTSLSATPKASTTSTDSTSAALLVDLEDDGVLELKLGSTGDFSAAGSFEADLLDEDGKLVSAGGFSWNVTPFQERRSKMSSTLAVS